jgi:hypothetical protein
MAFVVEDGSGRSDATSLLSVADFKTYWDDRGGDYSSYDDTQIEQALVRSTDHLNRTWDWVGRPTDSDQALCWPRYGAYDKDGYAIDDDEIPTEVEQAAAELALRAAAEDLSPDIEAPLKSFKAGSLEVEWVTGSTSPKTYAEVEDLLSGLVLGTGHGTVQLDLV